MYSKAFTLLALLGAVQSHMHLDFPPTLLGDNNPHTPQGGADPKLNYPYGCCGQTNVDPCKGHLGLLDQPEGRPVATWKAGQAANFTLSGNVISNTNIENPRGGTHAGGSCQWGVSIDKGKSFKVIKTWQGNCPQHDSPSLDPSAHVFDFTVPADLPSGDAVFAWTWINREKEFNMNCAVVTIAGGNGEAPEEPQEPQDPEEPQQPQSSQYTLEGCTCSCPSQSWTEGCQCYSCGSPTTKRRDVERKALAMHKRQLQQAQKLSAPHRRAEMVAFSARPDMALNIDIPGSECKSQGNPAEVLFPNPGPEVEGTEDNDGYPLAEPICS